MRRTPLVQFKQRRPSYLMYSLALLVRDDLIDGGNLTVLHALQPTSAELVSPPGGSVDAESLAGGGVHARGEVQDVDLQANAVMI